MFRSKFPSRRIHTLKLYSFPLRGRTEFIRLMLAYGEVPYEDIRVHTDEWQSVKSSLGVNGTNEMPVLLVDGKFLYQAIAIGRYIAREYGLTTKDHLENAKGDMVVDSAMDVWEHLQSVHKVQQQGDIQLMIQTWAKFYDEHLKVFLTKCQERLAANGSGWFIGKSVTWVDFVVAEFLSVIQDCFTSDALDAFPKLTEYANNVLTLPNVKEYVSSRQRNSF